MNLNLEILEDALSLLESVLHQSTDSMTNHQKPDVRRSFVNRHAWNVYDVALDALLLAKFEKTGSLYLLARPALESLFNLVAAVNNPQFAIEKLVSEVEEERGKVEKWRATVRGEAAVTLDLILKELTDYAADLRQRYSYSGQRKWKIYEIANEAGMSARYVADYYRGSAHVHAMISALTAREHLLDGESAMRALTLAVIDASAYVNHFFLKSVQILKSVSELQERVRTGRSQS